MHRVLEQSSVRTLPRCCLEDNLTTCLTSTTQLECSSDITNKLAPGWLAGWRWRLLWPVVICLGTVPSLESRAETRAESAAGRTGCTGVKRRASGRHPRTHLFCNCWQAGPTNDAYAHYPHHPRPGPALRRACFPQILSSRKKRLWLLKLSALESEWLPRAGLFWTMAEG